MITGERAVVVAGRRPRWVDQGTLFYRSTFIALAHLSLRYALRSVSGRGGVEGGLRGVCNPYRCRDPYRRTCCGGEAHERSNDKDDVTWPPPSYLCETGYIRHLNEVGHECMKSRVG